jgi:uncharacterized membrane protein YhiD involved in acid resistance
MEWHNQAYIIFQIFTAFFLGGFIGFERERHGISAGIRTYAAVCMGSAMFRIYKVRREWWRISSRASAFWARV